MPGQSEPAFSLSVLKKRRKLVEVLKHKKFDHEIVIAVHRKPVKIGSEMIENFRGSRFRGISKNGNAWQILLMVNRKK
jgi:hypothetical protein